MSLVSLISTETENIMTKHHHPHSAHAFPKEFEGDLGLTNDEKAQLSAYVAGETPGIESLTIGERTFFRIHRNGATSGEWSYNAKPEELYFLKFSDYTKTPPHHVTAAQIASHEGNVDAAVAETINNTPYTEVGLDEAASGTSDQAVFVGDPATHGQEPSGEDAPLWNPVEWLTKALADAGYPNPSAWTLDIDPRAETDADEDTRIFFANRALILFLSEVKDRENISPRLLLADGVGRQRWEALMLKGLIPWLMHKEAIEFAPESDPVELPVGDVDPQANMGADAPNEPAGVHVPDELQRAQYQDPAIAAQAGEGAQEFAEKLMDDEPNLPGVGKLGISESVLKTDIPSTTEAVLGNQLDARPVKWSDILERPETFPPLNGEELRERLEAHHASEDGPYDGAGAAPCSTDN